MVRYCPFCGRSAPNDARLCAYCGKMIPIHEAPIIAEQEPKKDKTALIIVLVVVILLIVPIAISAAVYVYVSGMIGPSPSTGNMPSVYFLPNYTDNTLTVMSTESNLKWDDFSIVGICNTSGLGTYVTFGDMLTNCSGQIIITYESTGVTTGTWTFS